jgi:hypothetical protein
MNIRDPPKFLVFSSPFLGFFRKGAVNVVKERGIEATISKVIFRKKGSYFVAYPLDENLLPEGESITCSLKNWKDDDEFSPLKGQIALLFGVREFENGWRASVARPKKLC